MTTTTEANTIERLQAENDTLRQERDQAWRVVKLQKHEIAALRGELNTYRASRYLCNLCGARWDTGEKADECHVRHGQRGAV